MCGRLTDSPIAVARPASTSSAEVLEGTSGELTLWRVIPRRTDNRSIKERASWPPQQFSRKCTGTLLRAKLRRRGQDGWGGSVTAISTRRPVSRIPYPAAGYGIWDTG